MLLAAYGCSGLAGVAYEIRVDSAPDPSSRPRPPAVTTVTRVHGVGWDSAAHWAAGSHRGSAAASPVELRAARAESSRWWPFRSQAASQRSRRFSRGPTAKTAPRPLFDRENLVHVRPAAGAGRRAWCHVSDGRASGRLFSNAARRASWQVIWREHSGCRSRRLGSRRLPDSDSRPHGPRMTGMAASAASIASALYIARRDLTARRRREIVKPRGKQRATRHKHPAQHAGRRSENLAEIDTRRRYRLAAMTWR